MNNDWKVYYYQKRGCTYPVKEYIDSLTTREKAKTLAFIELLQSIGPNLKRPYADLIRDGIHELRLKLTGTQVRILYFFCFQNAIVLTNVFEKHTDTVPESEINTALNCRADFYERFTEKDFQEDENDEF
jgi:phage-related protein